MRILGIETSCDETAAAVVQNGNHILSNVVASQVELHARYGGIVPEVASRQHLLSIETTITESLNQANLSIQDLNEILKQFKSKKLEKIQIKYNNLNASSDNIKDLCNSYNVDITKQQNNLIEICSIPIMEILRKKDSKILKNLVRNVNLTKETLTNSINENLLLIKLEDIKQGKILLYRIFDLDPPEGLRPDIEQLKI